MVAPYRTPAPLEPSPDIDPCAAPCGCVGLCAHHAVVCLHTPCPRAQTPEAAGRARGPADRGGPWAKAVTVAALFLLSGATASVMALAWKVTMAPPTDAGALQVQQIQAAGPAAEPTASKGDLPPRRSKRSRSRACARGNDATSVAAARPSFDLSSLGSPTHAPEELWARAANLSAAGADIVLTETSLAHRSVNDLEQALGPSARIVPNASFPGICIASLAPGSLARAAGLQKGDVVTAVNGHPLTSPDVLLTVHASVRQSQTAVVELRRGGRAIVLKLRIRP